LDEVNEKSDYIVKSLTGVLGIESVTGMGLMLGVKPVNKTAKEVANACMAKGVLVLTAKDKVRLLPALNIPMEDLKKGIEVLKEVCNN
ncbi:MAG: aminotransferase class III-fold pyridoxal phosphate-dependent enzyme, partial [Sphaerochaetaceae bacterium]|nr:aminotransferase class III-fold pyridoxal phosphate-dependent enzyme [Sphaerochaetaceae bacterium]